MTKEEYVESVLKNPGFVAIINDMKDDERKFAIENAKLIAERTWNSFFKFKDEIAKLDYESISQVREQLKKRM